MTKESFQNWWSSFSTEELRDLLEREDEAFDLLCGRTRPRPGEESLSRLTGRQLFEQQKVHSTSDISFLGDQDIDEAVFEGLEDLEISSLSSPGEDEH